MIIMKDMCTIEADHAADMGPLDNWSHLPCYPVKSTCAVLLANNRVEDWPKGYGKGVKGKSNTRPFCGEWQNGP